MGKIHVLDSDTINQIAAGEVVERPASVVKELVENAIDAGASAVTVEIKEGGIGFIRITDNGSGIPKEDIAVAFERHATSKIASALDLLSVKSLGFRGEALSSIAAVSMVELVTKTREEFTGNRYIIEGGIEKGLTEIGAPEGTTFLVRSLFYNTPARRKFLKSAMTEAGYISDLMERFAIAHPEIAFKFINNAKTTIQTSGNGNLKDCIYHIFGRDIAAALVDAEGTDAGIGITGFLGKPVISRGNRNYENYFINGRHIRSNIISKAIEEAYKPYSMQHKYPFTVLHFEIPPENIDVNVHPTKLEIRFTNGEALYQLVYRTVRDALSGKNMIPDAVLTEEKRQKTVYPKSPEPFELGRITYTREAVRDEAARVREEAIRATLGSGLFARQEEQAQEKAQQTDPAVVSGNSENAGSMRTSVQPSAEKTGSMSAVVLPPVEKTGSISNGDLPSVEKASGVQSGAEVSTVNASVLQGMIPSSGNAGAQQETIPSSGNTGALRETTQFGENSGAIHEAVRVGEKPLTQAERADAGLPAGREPVPEASRADAVSAQLSLFETAEKNKEAFLEKKQEDHHRIIGQLFATYWLVEFEEQLFIIDQHAAHEKILYEHTVKRMKDKQTMSQMITPPVILSLSIREEEILKRYMNQFLALGFEIEAFGGREYAVSAVPADLYGVDGQVLLMEMIDSLIDEPVSGTPDIILDKIASMSCKAAVKGNMRLSPEEAKALIHELLMLVNPFHCPHGRPIIISMTKHELERKFKRIVN